MYTVVVADDEYELRNAIVQRIDWNAAGFRVVGAAENGIEALELVEKLEPDLLLTDIKMPFLSGIDLARQVREIRPAMHIAFLSGYDDFSYAQQAIQYNIISYMLKPLSLEELTQELIAIREKMDARKEDFRMADRTPVRSMREDFLMPLLLDHTGQEQSDIEEKAVQYGFLHTPEERPVYVVLVTRLEQKDGRPCTLPQHTHSVDMILRKYVRFGSFYSNGKIVSLLAESRRELHKYLHIIVKELVQSIERLIHCRCIIGVSRETDRLTRCGTAYSEAITALQYAPDQPEGVSYIADIEHSADFEYGYIRQRTAKLDTLLKMGDEASLHAFLEELFGELERRKLAKADINLLVIQMIATVCQAVSTVAVGGAAERFFANSAVTGDIFMYRSMEDMQRNLTAYCMLAKRTIADLHRENSEVLCDNALHIIENEYGDEGLSLVSLSERLHISSNYLSAILKKVKGDTFTNFLTERRMQAARDYLLCSPLKILEISQKCGYSDQHYFSYCFKKHFGVSPNKMRESAVQAGKSPTEEV